MSQLSTAFDLQLWLTTAALSAAQHQHWHCTAVRQKTEWNMRTKSENRFFLKEENNVTM